MSMYVWEGNKLIDLEDHPKMMERWLKEDKLFSVGDKVIILDMRGYRDNIGYEWKQSMDKLVGRTRTIERRIVNYYGYCVGYRLKGCAGIFNPDFLMRKEIADKMKAIRNEPIQCNTRLEYLYRDACNYKTWNSVVLSGAMTDEIFDDMRSCCSDGYEDFVPEQLGLDLIRDWETNEDDHPWAELIGYELVPDEPTTDMTVNNLLKEFWKAKDNWHPEEYEPMIEEEDED